MKHTNFALLIPAGLLVLASACGPTAGTVEKKSETTTETSQGTVTTSAESTQVGTTLEAKSETTVETASGTVSAQTETIVGTVTAYTAGKSLEVLTGEKTTHSVNLDDKDIVFSIDGNVEVGKHVTVIHETGSDKVHRVTVKLAP
ncbi:MAG: hypothetical protein ACYC4P_14660 [Thermoanaerobaculia bacterium]